MNALRKLSYRTVRTAFKKQSPQRLSTTFHHRLFQKKSSPFFTRRITILNKKNPYPSFLSLRKASSSVFGTSVMAGFVKTSLIFYAIPISAAASPYFNTLPLDLIYGFVLPYHAHVGMHHILTDYFIGFTWVGSAIAIVMFLGLQNLNIQGEGISPMVRRVFTKEKIPTSEEEIKKSHWFNRKQTK
eukprot:UN11458